MKKRLFCLIITVVMLWGLMPVAAFAADTKIDSVEIKGMVVPQIGQKIEDMWDLHGAALDNGTLVVNNASYSAGYFGNLDSDGWELLDKNKKYIDLSPEDAFTAGTYYFSNWFRATSGYTFADEVTVTVSGATSVETAWDGEWLGVYAKYVLTEPKPVNKSNPFKDVGKKDYFYDAVLWAVDKGVTTGTSKNAFSPAADCTRAQVVTFLWRAAGSPAPKKSANPFKDVKSSQYYYKAVLWAVQKNVTTGLSATEFGPDASCTRAQVVTFLNRAAGTPKAKGSTNPFQDVKSNQYYYNAVLWAVEKGVTTGTGKNTFSPNATCTRGQIVTFLYRYFKSAVPAPKPDPLAVGISPDLLPMLGGEVANIKVAVTGGVKPYTYQWQGYNVLNESFVDMLESADAVGVNTAELFYRAPSHGVLDDYAVRCVVTDAKGNKVVSAAVPIVERLYVENQPCDIAADIGDTVVFTVTAAGGTEPYSYQWQYKNESQSNWTDLRELGQISGGKTPNLSVVATEGNLITAYLFRVVITDATGQRVISNEAALTEYRHLTVTAQPTDVLVSAGDVAEFEVGVAYGLPSYSYQWYFGVGDIHQALNETDTGVSGCNTANLSVTMTQDMLDLGAYFYCVVTDEYGDEVTSEVAYPRQRFTILRQSSSKITEAGAMETIDLKVAGGKAPYTYQWQRCFGLSGEFSDYGAPVTTTDKTSSITEEIVANHFDMMAQFRCVITDAEGATLYTEPVEFTELKPLTVTQQPEQAKYLIVGDRITFTVKVDGGIGPYTYRWQYKNDLLPDYVDTISETLEATSYTFDVLTDEIDQKFNGHYRCIVTDSRGETVTTQNAEMKFLFRNVLIEGPATAAVGSPATLRATAVGGSDAYSYNWQYSVSAGAAFQHCLGHPELFSGYDTATLTILNVTEDMAGYRFRCVVTNSGTTKTTESLALNIQP